MVDYDCHDDGDGDNSGDINLTSIIWALIYHMNSKRKRKNHARDPRTHSHTRWIYPLSLSLLDVGHRMIKQEETLQVTSQSHLFSVLSTVILEDLACIQRTAVIRCKGLQRGKMVWTSSSYTKGQGQAKLCPGNAAFGGSEFRPLLNFCFQINLKYYLTLNLTFLAAWQKFLLWKFHPMLTVPK